MEGVDRRMNIKRSGRKRLLFVATRQFWPTTTGKEITLFHNCKGLCEKYGYEIYLFCFADKNTDKQRQKPDFIHDVVYVDAPGIKKSFPLIMKNSLLTGKWPIQNSMLYSRHISKELQKYYQKIKPDVLIIDMVRLVPYFDDLPVDSIKKILIEDDLLAKRYRQQLKTSGEGNITGYLSSSMPGLLNSIVSCRFVKNIILKTEIKRLDRYEKCLPNKFDYITFISPIEAEEFNRQNDTDKAVTLTMGADIEYCAQIESVAEHKDNSMVIVGNYSYAPNAASLKWICEKVMPLLPENITYYIIGNFPKELRQAIKDERIKPLGYVDDIRTVVKSTEIYLSPVLFGTGIKTKVVEAMAMGMPVITNTVGAEGLNVTDGKELFIKDTPEDIAKTVKMILDDTQLGHKVGKRGQKFVAQYHDWNKIYQVFGQMGL